MVLDFADYKAEAYRQLSDSAVYESVKSDPSCTFFPSSQINSKFSLTINISIL